MRAFALAFIFSIMPFATAVADSCGMGHIVSVMEGGWGKDAFAVKLDNSDGASVHPGTDKDGWVIFNSASISNRIDGIRSIALAAYVSGNSVSVHARSANCSDADEIRIGPY